MPSCPIQSPSFKFSKKPQTISGNLQFSIRLKSSSCALDAIESNPTGHWAFGDAQNLPGRLQDGFQKTPTKLSTPNRPNSKPGKMLMQNVGALSMHVRCLGKYLDEMLCPGLL